MGTDWYLRKKSGRKPTKSNLERKRRQKTQAKRLVALGVSADKVAAMNPKQVRDLLKRPVRTAKKAQKAKKA